MGFGNIASHILIFIGVVFAAGSMLILFKAYIGEVSDSLRVQQKILVNQLKSDVTINTISYDNSSNTTLSVFVTNSGKTKLSLTQVDVYIDGFRIPRNDSNRTIEVKADSEIHNKGIWDPNEQIEIAVNINLSNNISHSLIITGPYDTKDIDSFNV